MILELWGKIFCEERNYLESYILVFTDKWGWDKHRRIILIQSESPLWDFLLYSLPIAMTNFIWFLALIFMNKLTVYEYQNKEDYSDNIQI